MKNWMEQIRSSAHEMKQVSTISVAGLLVAISVVLAFFKLAITETLQISFAFLPIAGGGMLFGPVVGGIIGAVSDVAGFVMRPTGPFFPGFTISAMVTGALFGQLLYRKPITAKRVLTACILNTVLVNWVLNTLWLSLMYGNGFIILLGARIIKNLIMLPIDTALLFSLLKLFERFRFINKAKGNGRF